MYLQQCTCEEKYEPEHAYVFTGPCIMTGKPHTVTLPAQGLFHYNHGMLVQDAFPNVSAEDREFITSGVGPEGWESLTEGKDELDEAYEAMHGPEATLPPPRRTAITDYRAAFEMHTHLKPTGEQVLEAQLECGYHPSGYGAPMNITSRQEDGHYITTWQCFGSCD